MKVKHVTKGLVRSIGLMEEESVKWHLCND